jgi:hypothetical protein
VVRDVETISPGDKVACEIVSVEGFPNLSKDDLDALVAYVKSLTTK